MWRGKYYDIQVIFVTWKIITPACEKYVSFCTGWNKQYLVHCYDSLFSFLLIIGTHIWWLKDAIFLLCTKFLFSENTFFPVEED